MNEKKRGRKPLIRSMTGYGRGESVSDRRTVTVEIRSVNNRYLDCSVKMPRTYIFAEDAIKSKIQSSISRGKVDVYVTIDNASSDAATVSLNRPVAEGYYTALTELRDAFGLRDDISVSLLSHFPDILILENAPEDLEAVAADILSALEIGLKDFTAMREREGTNLSEDILSRAETIKQLTGLVEEQTPRTVMEYRNRLEARMKELLESTQIEESRILTEAAFFADKVAVDEETVRLRSHLSQLCLLLKQEGPVGRKLDFLIQEFNREANTIGSKCNDIETSRHVIEIKSEIEKIREQVQNIE